MREERGSTESYYGRLAATYDENWASSPDFVRWMGARIASALRLEPGDQIADLGCGTGLFAQELLELAKPKDPILCVDPSAERLGRLPADARLVGVQASAEEIAARQVTLPHAHVDAVLIKEAVHHFEDPAEVLAGLGGLLAPGGRLLVVMLPTRIDYPLFGTALDRFTQLQPDPMMIAGHLRVAGLRVSLSQVEYPLSFDTERYVGMVRDRYMSLLSTFSDAEIETGIAEIRKRYPQPWVSFTDRFVFVLGVAG